MAAPSTIPLVPSVQPLFPASKKKRRTMSFGYPGVRRVLRGSHQMMLGISSFERKGKEEQKDCDSSH